MRKGNVQKYNQSVLKILTLTLGLLSCVSLKAGVAVVAPRQAQMCKQISLEDWYRLEDWGKMINFRKLSEEDFVRMDPQEMRRIQKIMDKEVFRRRLRKAFATKLALDFDVRFRIWYALSDECKEFCFGAFCEEDQVRIWRKLTQEGRSRCFKHLYRSLRQKFFSDLDQAVQAKYRSEHHQASKVRF